MAQNHSDPDGVIVDLSMHAEVPRDKAGYLLALGPGHGTPIFIGSRAEADRMLSLVRP